MSAKGAGVVFTAQTSGGLRVSLSLLHNNTTDKRQEEEEGGKERKGREGEKEKKK